MERLGPREYRCTHCGAITVVSQDQADKIAAPPMFGSSYTSSTTSSSSGGTTNTVTSSSTSYLKSTSTTQGNSSSGKGLLLFAAIVAVVAYSIFGGSSSSSSSSSTSSSTTPPPVPIEKVTMGGFQWMNDPNASVASGHYVALITNKSAWPITVPRYSMTMYVHGIKGATANSEVPVDRLLPGEYEPISFAFQTPEDDARNEIADPDSAPRSTAAVGSFSLAQTQLVREQGKPGYRVVGVVTNKGNTSVASAEVMVMLFGAGHSLLGFGRGYTHGLSAGERAAIEVAIPVNNINPVTSFEYLIDGTPESGQ